MVSARQVARNVFDLLGGFQTVLLAIAAVVAVVYFAMGNGQFLSEFTILSILLSSSWFGVLAVGTTFALAASHSNSIHTS